MECARHGQRDRLDAQGGRGLRRRLDTRLETGEHDLRVGIDVRDRQAALVADFLKLFGGSAHDADHAARLFLTRLLHEAAARLKDREGGFEIEHARHMQSRPLAEAQAGGGRERHLRAAFLEGAEGRDAHGEDRGLADV